MKKYLLLVCVAIAMLAVGCSKDSPNNPDTPPEVRLTVTPNVLTLTHDRTAKLTVEGSTGGTVTYKSENPFIASVSEDGTVKGGVRGETNIVVSSGDKKALCKVTVKTLINFIKEPILEFGQSVEYIKSKFPESSDVISEGNVIGYKSEGSDIIYGYQFKDGKLNSSAIMIPVLSDDVKSVVDFVLERYVVVERTGTYSYILISPDKTLGVNVSISGRNLIVIFLPYKSNSQARVRTVGYHIP